MLNFSTALILPPCTFSPGFFFSLTSAVYRALLALFLSPLHLSRSFFSFPPYSFFKTFYFYSILLDPFFHAFVSSPFPHSFFFSFLGLLPQMVVAVTENAPLTQSMERFSRLANRGKVTTTSLFVRHLN
jgi:hypothetical protein